jgi:uncharacterized membrane protein
MPISKQTEAELSRWLDARLIDPLTAERIRTFEQTRGRDTSRNWPMLIALSFGALMLAAGILLFIAAHWDNMSPWSRFALVMSVLAAMHLVGAVTSERAPHLSVAMHAIGTIACGGGIFLTGQIFNLQEHWPTGVLLWALAAWIAWALLRHWTQAALAAIFTPAWLCSEWVEAMRNSDAGFHVYIEGILLLATVYLAARSAEQDTSFRRALNWIGGLAFIPAYLVLAFEGRWWASEHLSRDLLVIGWIVAILGPLVVAFLLRGVDSWPSMVAAVWIVIFGYLPFHFDHTNVPLSVYALRTLGPYLWGALGSVGLIAWGVRDRMKNRINFGMAMFVVTLICFYFSDLLDKFGRSVSLISFGVLFLVIAYFLEKARKRLIAQIAKAGA